MPMFAIVRLIVSPGMRLECIAKFYLFILVFLPGPLRNFLRDLPSLGKDGIKLMEARASPFRGCKIFSAISALFE